MQKRAAATTAVVITSALMASTRPEYPGSLGFSPGRAWRRPPVATPSTVELSRPACGTGDRAAASRTVALEELVGVRGERGACSLLKPEQSLTDATVDSVVRGGSMRRHGIRCADAAADRRSRA